MNMNAQEIRFRLTHALTEYDRKQSKKRFYNPYALGQYLLRLDSVCEDIEQGAEPRQAILAAFNDRLLDVCLRALKLPISTNDETINASIVYNPVSTK